LNVTELTDRQLCTETMISSVQLAYFMHTNSNNNREISPHVCTAYMRQF